MIAISAEVDGSHCRSGEISTMHDDRGLLALRMCGRCCKSLQTRSAMMQTLMQALATMSDVTQMPLQAFATLFAMTQRLSQRLVGMRYDMQTPLQAIATMSDVTQSSLQSLAARSALSPMR